MGSRTLHVTDEDRFDADGVTLRLVTPQDCTDRYLGWLNDADVTRFLETRWHDQTLDTIRSFVAAQRASETTHLFAILTDRHVGNIKIGPCDPNQGVADVSYFIGERTSWGKGVAGTAVKIAVRIGFDVLGLHRLQAGAHAENVGSQKVLERAGFVLEGRSRGRAVVDGQRQDILHYGLLRQDAGHGS